MVLLLPLLGRSRATFLLHPLFVGAFTGGLAGDLSIGWIAGITVSPWSEALSRGRPSMSAAFGAAVGAGSGVLLAWQSLLGGFLVEAFAGGVVGVTVAVLLSPLEDRVSAPSRIVALGGIGATFVVLWVAWGVLMTWPEGVRAAAPWLSGAAMVVGLGVLCGRRDVSGGGEARTAGGLAVLLAGNFAGPVGVLGLPILWPLERIGRGKWIARSFTVALVIAIAILMAWFPYQLPSQETPLIPGLPGTQSPIGPVANAVLVPLALLAGLGAGLLRRPVLGLVALPILAPVLMSGW